MTTTTGNGSDNNTNTNGSNNDNTGREGMFLSPFLFILLTKIYIDYAYGQQQQQPTIQ